MSIVVAELFYKFHGFTLECVAYLATWYVIDELSARPYAALRRAIRRATTARAEVRPA